jgi:hypothetical protein
MTEPEPYSTDAERTVPDAADEGFGGPNADEPLPPAADPTFLPDDADPADVYEQTQEVPVDDEERA